MIAGIILAGGRSSRMGGRNKALLELGGKTLLARLTERFAPQVHALAVNSNAELNQVSGPNPVLPDRFADFPGPLAGLDAGMCWAEGITGITHIASVSVDTPFLPADFVNRLSDAGKGVAVARCGGRLHPTCALWPVSLRDTLEAFLRAGTSRRVLDFAAAAGYVAVDFPAVPFDPFFNVNTPEELARAESLLEAAE